MWIKQMILVVLGLSAGVTAAGGLFSFIVGLGVVSHFAIYPLCCISRFFKVLPNAAECLR